MAVELRVIDSSGNNGEILPDWSDLTFSQDLIASGSLTFKYPLNGRNAEYLNHGQILAILIDGQEPINGRFTYFEGDGSRLDGDVIAGYGCNSNLDRFEKIRLAPAFGSIVADENMFAFTNKTPGWLVNNAIENSRSRSNSFTANPNWFTYPVGFSATHDSAGYAWPTTYDVRFTPGASVLEVIDFLNVNGFAEAHMSKKVLKLFLPENNGRDLTITDIDTSSTVYPDPYVLEYGSSTTNPVVLQTGRDFIEATYQTSSRDLVTALLVQGENNSCTWVYDTAAIAEHGYREGTLSVSNASTQPTLQAAGLAHLATRKIPRYSYTYSVSALYLEQQSQNVRPFIDYQVGDSILILDGMATAVQRIRMLSASWPTAKSATVNLTVNDWLQEKEIQLSRHLSRLGLSG